jgi:hypothetical protein
MGTWTFTYDALNRLISGAPAAGNQSNGGLSLCWGYDSFGNRTAQSAQSAACPTPLPPTANYNAGNQVTWTSVNGAVNGLAYDPAGNVTGDNLNTYLYDGEGRICAVASYPFGGNSGMAVMTGYIYDADGTRVALDKDEGFVKHKKPGRCVSTADFARGLRTRALGDSRCITIRRA